MDEIVPLLNAHNKEEYPPAHTAEHLLNQTMIRMFGCERSRNTHIERKKSKMNFGLSVPPTPAQIAEIEERVNKLIQEDLPVEYEFVKKDQISPDIPLDKLPNDASELLRLVKIGDYDICACIGKHVNSTKEIGSFRITSTNFQPPSQDGEHQETGSFRIVYKVDGAKY